MSYRTEHMPVSAGMIATGAGTWTLKQDSTNGLVKERTAADASTTAVVPIPLPGSAASRRGCKLLSVAVWYSIGTAAADSVDLALYKTVKPAHGGDPTDTDNAESVTLDAGNDSAAERKATGFHKAVLTLDTPAFMDDSVEFYVLVTVDAAATTVLQVRGAQVNYQVHE